MTNTYGRKKLDPHGRASGQLKVRRCQKIAGQFVAHRVDMMTSLAWGALPHAARRVMDRLEIEHMNHGGCENGMLACTYDDFARYGIRRQSIPVALIYLEALGFIEVTEQGRASFADLRTPSRYRLTFLNTLQQGPTDEWERIDTEDKLHAVLARIEDTITRRRTLSRIKHHSRKQKAGCDFGHAPGAKTHLKSVITECEDAPTVPGAKTHPLSISTGDRDSRPRLNEEPRTRDGLDRAFAGAA